MLTVDTLKNELLKHLNIVYKKWDKDSGDFKYIPGYIPIAILKACLALDLEDTSKLIPKLRGIVNHPLLAKDLSVIDAYGYDAKNELFINNHAHVIPMEPMAALKILEDILADFPFNSESDMKAICLLGLTMVCKQLYDGATPIFGVFAPKEGSGKTLLMQVVLACITGQIQPAGSVPPDDAEMEKRIATIVLSGEQIFFLDNIPTGRTFDMPSLASVVLSRKFSGRMPGLNKQIKAPFESIVLLTGNNSTFTPEGARRLIPSFLAEKPKARTAYRHDDILNYCIENHQNIVSAFISIAKYGMENGTESAFILDSFEPWSAVIGRIAKSLGWDDALEKQATLYSASVNSEFIGVEEFLEDAATLGLFSYSATELLPAAKRRYWWILKNQHAHRHPPFMYNPKRLEQGIDIRPTGGLTWLYTGIKTKGPYQLNGSFNLVPDISIELVKYLEYTIYVPQHHRIFKTDSGTLLERAREAAISKKGAANRNQVILHIATAAAFGDIPQEEILSFIQADSLLASHDRITETVQRAYRYAAGK
ncbi:hypothetical protein FACS1894163_02400 [Spirochaetia bacterium]|nr:hypothetical protein FACS1894163_02400 [Spirochaetia bacterium]